jgi:hypothetical protein
MANLPKFDPMAQPIFPDGAAFGTGSPAETAQQPSGLYDLMGGAYNWLGHLAQRAIGASETMRTQGTYDPAPMVEAAMLPMGTGAVAGLKMAPGEMALGAGPIRAYHGSPHDFDRFDLSKIGTGEGAQAYGHGLYFAEKEGVARGYRDTLSGDVLATPKGRLFDPQTELEHLNVRSRAHSNGSNLDATIELAQRMAAGDAPSAVMAQRDLAKLLELKAEGGVTRHKGKMYEVNINADPAHFLDWDKPLAADHAILENVRDNAKRVLENASFGGTRNAAKDAFLAANSGNMTGEGAYRALALGNSKLGNLPSPSAASRALNEAGIPGIKYLDQGSRGAGEGSSNYVVFNDKLIDIMRKYGIAGLMGPPIFASATGEQKN